MIAKNKKGMVLNAATIVATMLVLSAIVVTLSYIADMEYGGITGFSIGGATVSACGELNQSSTVYTLTNDITGISGSCFNITADSITLDMAGYNLTGTDNIGDYGVYINGYNNIIIKNGEFYDLHYPIYLSSSNGNFVDNIIAGSNTAGSESGIVILHGSNNNIISNSISIGNAEGIHLQNSHNNTLSNLTITSSLLYGIEFYNGEENNTFINIVSYSNGFSEIGGTFGSGNKLIYNNSFGEIKFLDDISSDISGRLGFNNNLSITNNSAFLNSSSELSELNKSANITLELAGWNINNPQILKDGNVCSSPECNILSYTGVNGIIVFNVTGWSNYTVENVPLLPPNVSLISPADDYEDIDGNITFNCNATDDTGLVNITLWTNISGTWIANKTNIITGTSNTTQFTLTEINDGNYSWNCEAYDEDNNSAFASFNRTFNVNLPLPNATNFNTSLGTNFSAVPDITNVTNLTLATVDGKIQFPIDHSIDASGEDYDSYVKIGNKFISVDTAALDPTFNASANLTINNVTCPISVYYGSGVYAASSNIVDEGNICDAGSDPACTNIDCTGSTLTFTVSHFTGFASGPTTNLTIWDETDTNISFGNQTKNPLESVKFFANYTNATGPIQGANCIIKFNDMSASMSYNSSGFYEYNRNFSTSGLINWNTTCNKTGFGTLTATDTVNITPFSPLAGVWCGPQCTFLCGGLDDTADGSWDTYACGGQAQARRNITIPANTISASWNFKFDNTNASAHHVSANCYDYTSSSWTNFYTPISKGLQTAAAGIPLSCLKYGILQVEIDLKNIFSIYYEGQATFTISTGGGGGGGGGTTSGCTTSWNCTWGACQPLLGQEDVVHSGTQTGACTDIGTCNSTPEIQTRFCLYEPLTIVSDYEVSPQPGEPPSTETGKGIKSSGFFTTKSLQTETMVTELINNGEVPLEDVEVMLETPEKTEAKNIYTTKVSAGKQNTEISGMSTFDIMHSDLLKWNISSKYFKEVKVGEKINTNFSIMTPLTDYKDEELNLIISSEGVIIANETINISIDVPEFLVVPDYHEEEDIVDIYMVMFNKENKEREFNIEFNLNKDGLLQKTVIAEYYGPYKIKANNITIAGYRYKFSPVLMGSNYTLKAGLFENGKKIAESEKVLDLTKRVISEKPVPLTSRLGSFIFKNTIYLIIILSSIFLAVIVLSIYKHERVKIIRNIEDYKKRRFLEKAAKKARKRREQERKIKEYKEKRRIKLLKRAAQKRSKKLEIENELRRRSYKLRAKRLEQHKKEKEKAAARAAKLRKQRLEERRKNMFEILAETRKRRLEKERLERKRLKEKAKIRKKASKRAVKSLEKKQEYDKQLKIKRDELRKISNEIKKIGERPKNKR